MRPSEQSSDRESGLPRARDAGREPWREERRHDAETDRQTIDQLRQAAHSDRRTIAELREQRDHATAQIHQMDEEAAESARIASAQHALVAALRSAVGDAADHSAQIGRRLAAAETELVDLRAIRDALLSPTLVQRDGLSIAAEVFPAEPHVGGDFFYVGDGPRGSVVLAVGDVVGKGIVAARRAAFTRTALASVASFSDDPAQLLRWVNVALVERIGESADFVTAICVTIDPGTRRLRVASAGHHPAARLNSATELCGLHNGGALGLNRSLRCESAELTLDPGDGALLFTDGVLEARGADTRFGTDRLYRTLARVAGEPPTRIIAELKADLDRFTSAGMTDDVCMLAIRLD